MDRARAVRISKLMSLGLRHDPMALGLVLDGAGWCDVETLLSGLAANGERIDLEELYDLVETSDKQRFAISPDGAKIRANQGHSIDVDLGLSPRDPPEILFHGTVDRFLASIEAQGLVRGSRTHVHLSVDEETARIVAARRRGTKIILRVRAAAMAEAGYRFFLSDNGVWLTDAVPPRFLER